MVVKSSSRKKKPSLAQEDDNGSSKKQTLFSVLSFFLQGKTAINPMVAYAADVIEALSFLWFLLHPTLNIIHPDSFLVAEFRSVLKTINFYEYLQDGLNYQVMLAGALGVVTLALVLILASSCQSLNNQRNQYLKYLRNSVNIIFILLAKALSGPFIGLSISVLYCDEKSPYHQGAQCYTPSHIMSCILAVVLLLSMILSMVIYSLFYFTKNPFEGGCLGHPNRNYMLSKGLLKLLFPIFFALNASLNLSFLFLIFAPALWGTYIFFHRINSLHSFNHRHFYFEYFLECFLFWVSMCGILSKYFDGEPSSQPKVLFYALVSSLIVAYTLVNVERQMHRQFLEECLEGRIKKQNIDRFILALINKLLYSNSKNRKIYLKNYSQIIEGQCLPQDEQDQDEDTKQEEQNQNKQIHEFFLKLVNRYLEENNSPTLKITKCYLLRILDYKYYSVHQMLELSQQKLSLMEEFTLFDFGRENQIRQSKKSPENAHVLKMYRYHDQNGKFDEKMEECAQNNAEYWEQLSQVDPSLPKLRNLSTNYVRSSAQIAAIYAKIKELFPQSCAPTANYLHFLLQVGVDARQTIKMREELRGKLEGNSKSTLAGFGEEVCMVAVDSVGKKIGNIVNCNSKVKELLGFEKESILDKNITRIMPKVYTELHNSFITNFIRRKHVTADIDMENSENMLRTTSNIVYDKMVTPINSQSYLIQATLALHTLNTSQSSLNVIGFMNKVEQSNEGLVMVESTSGEILAIDQTFANMIKKKVTGKQIIQEELKLLALLPEINLNLFEKQEYQDSHLEIGNLEDEQGNLKESCIVRVKTKRTKIYQNHKLMFLSVSQKIPEKSNKYIMPFTKRYSNGSIQLPSMDTPVFDEKMTKTNQLKAMESHDISEVTACIESQGGAELNRDIILIRKLDQYIEEKQGHQFKLYIRGCYLLIFIVMTVYLGISFCLRSQYLDKATKMHETMQFIAATLRQEAQVNLYNNQIWCVVTKHYFPNHQNIYPKLATSVTDLSNNFAAVIESTLNEDESLVFNEETLHTFRTFVRNTSSYANLSMTFRAALENYINAGKKMQNQSMVARFYAIDPLLVQMSSFFITQNGDMIIPELTISAMKSYLALFEKISSNEKKKTIILKSCLIILSILCLVGVILLGKSLNKVQKQIFEFHSNLRLWDVNELALKCESFLQKRGKASKRKKRRSSLLKIFPIKTLIDIIEPQNMKDRMLKSKKPMKTSTLHPEQEEEKWLKVQEPSQSSNMQQNGQKDKEAKIQIDWLQNHNRALAILSIVTIVAILILGFSMYFHYSTADELSQKFEFTKNSGILLKSIAYLNLFPHRIAANHSITSYALNVETQIVLFYKKSTLTYEQYGNTVFKNIYGYVEMLQIYFSRTSTYPIAMLRDLYFNKISPALEQAYHKIMEMDRTIFQPAFAATISSARSRDLIFTMVLWGLGVLLILLVHLLYIHPIHTQRTQTLNMLKIIPAWMLERNPDTHRYLTQ